MLKTQKLSFRLQTFKYGHSTDKLHPPACFPELKQTAAANHSLCEEEGILAVFLDKSPTTTNHSLWKEVELETKCEDTGAGKHTNLAAYSRQTLTTATPQNADEMMDGPLSLAKGMKERSTEPTTE